MEYPYLPRAIEEGLSQEKDTWGEDRIHVSDLAVTLDGNDKKCPREFWMRLRGYKKKPLTPGKKLMFDHGNRIHERIADVITSGLEEQWEIIGIESPVIFREFNITGTTDFVIRNIYTEEIFIVDFKTVRGRAFYHLDDAKESHKLQVQSYAYGKDADGGLVLYIDREGQNAQMQFPVERNDEKVKRAIEETLQIAQQEKIPPKLDYTIQINENKGPDSIKVCEPWQCQYCDYKDVSCDGALPVKFRTNSIVGKVDDEGNISYKKGFEYFKELLGGELVG